MKKDYSIVSQTPIKRQLLPCPPSKPSPQKTAVENTQKQSKYETAAFLLNGGQQKNQTKQVINFKYHANFIEIRKVISRSIHKI